MSYWPIIDADKLFGWLIENAWNQQPPAMYPWDTIARDFAWRNPPAVVPDCDHDFRVAPVVEFRQTVYCRTCHGLAMDLSRELEACPEAFIIKPDGSITRKEATPGAAR